MAWTVTRLSFHLFYRRIGMFLAGNVLWVLVSIPIITIPAATGALFYLTQRVISEEEDKALELASHKDFWVGLRKHWARSTLLGFLDLAALLVLVVSLQFYLTRPQALLRWLVGPILIFALVWMGMQIFLFPLLIEQPDKPILQVVKQAMFLAIGYPLFNLQLILVMILLLIVCISLAGPVLVILFSLLALIQSVAWRSIRIEERY